MNNNIIEIDNRTGAECSDYYDLLQNFAGSKFYSPAKGSSIVAIVDYWLKDMGDDTFAIKMARDLENINLSSTIFDDLEALKKERGDYKGDIYKVVDDTQTAYVVID